MIHYRKPSQIRYISFEEDLVALGRNHDTFLKSGLQIWANSAIKPTENKQKKIEKSNLLLWLLINMGEV